MATATKKEKKRKEEANPWKAGASSGHINLKQSILETFNIYANREKKKFNNNCSCLLRKIMNGHDRQFSLIPKSFFLLKKKKFFFCRKNFLFFSFLLLIG
jgi:hypothetical protein